jgi:hypothetical protein
MLYLEIYFITVYAGELLVPEGCHLCPVVSSLSLTWFIRYINVWILQFLSNVIYLSKDQSTWDIGNLSWFWLSCLDPLLAHKDLHYIAFQYFSQERSWWWLSKKRTLHTKTYLSFYLCYVILCLYALYKFLRYYFAKICYFHLIRKLSQAWVLTQTLKYRSEKSPKMFFFCIFLI